MTPEQEERLGQMMLEHSRRNGHASKFPPDPHYRGGNQPLIRDEVTITQIEQFLQTQTIPATRAQINVTIKSGVKRIDRCLKKMKAAGTVRVIQGRNKWLWELVRK